MNSNEDADAMSMTRVVLDSMNSPVLMHSSMQLMQLRLMMRQQMPAPQLISSTHDDRLHYYYHYYHYHYHYHQQHRLLLEHYATKVASAHSHAGLRKIYFEVGSRAG